MGSIYKRGDSRFLWIQYTSVDGRSYAESSHSTKQSVAKRLLRLKEGDVEHGVPVTPKVGRLAFSEAMAALVDEYRANGRRTLGELKQRIAKHLTPYFGVRRMMSITTTVITAYTAKRLDAGAAPATVNRELAAVKRAFTLAVQAGTLTVRPHIPMLAEDNVRKGFFEPDQYASVVAHLPEALRPVVRFAAITGWRVPSEVLKLEWRNVDFRAGEVRLDPGVAKNQDGRTFPFTVGLRALLEEQRAEADELKQRGVICPWVFHRDGKRIRAFRDAWQTACKAAGCPGRVVHDLRRTAVRSFERAGVPRSVATKLSGHKTESVYRRYAIVSSGDLRDAAKRLDEAPGTVAGALAGAGKT